MTWWAALLNWEPPGWAPSEAVVAAGAAVAAAASYWALEGETGAEGS